MDITIIYPSYYRIVRCENGRWFIKGAKLCSPNHIPIGMQDADKYDMSSDELLISLFRINGGRSGYYLANLRDKKYYYCGLALEDARRQLLALGIGRDEP